MHKVAQLNKTELGFKTNPRFGKEPKRQKEQKKRINAKTFSHIFHATNKPYQLITVIHSITERIHLI